MSVSKRLKVVRESPGPALGISDVGGRRLLGRLPTQSLKWCIFILRSQLTVERNIEIWLCIGSFTRVIQLISPWQQKQLLVN